MDRGLYFRVTDQGTGFWVLRYQLGVKRREMSLGRYGRSPEGLSLAEAKLKAGLTRAEINNGIDPIAEKKRTSLTRIRSVDDVAADWLLECKNRLENPHIPERVYRKDIAPAIGELSIVRVNATDIKGILRSIDESGRPAIANDALSYLKQIFNHAIKLGLVISNPATVFSVRDAGGIEKSRDRILSIEEIRITFKVFRRHSSVVTRENYLAMALLVILGVRKGELIAAKWAEFDLENKIWTLPPARTKTKSGIVIPLPEKILPWLNELAIRAVNSEYLFPSRRQSRRRAYISDDTLNHALAKMFGAKVDSKKKPLPNILGAAGVEHFVIHDLRRTCRSLLAKNGVPPHIAEKCLNHKLKGVEAIYDRYDYLQEREKALTDLSEIVAPLV